MKPAADNSNCGGISTPPDHARDARATKPPRPPGTSRAYAGSRAADFAPSPRRTKQSRASRECHLPRQAARGPSFSTKATKLPPTSVTRTGVAEASTRVATRPRRVATPKRTGSAAKPPAAAPPANEWRLVAIDFGPASTDPRRRQQGTPSRASDHPTPETVLSI
ncbi:PREDICTED: uncharacterized protein LOC105460944 [Wasmannia auropunctata]|uniref:uncharacterized protein LOC105460944 n=1 Tax=Wasmannia auropunctata TaxID=64793 RepID=UPI0005EEE842|nr:PREDICTED: uncharacterized protein LOC105460944 [Wasmannia auropunctata]